MLNIGTTISNNHHFFLKREVDMMIVAEGGTKRANYLHKREHVQPILCPEIYYFQYFMRNQIQ